MNLSQNDKQVKSDVVSQALCEQFEFSMSGQNSNYHGGALVKCIFCSLGGKLQETPENISAASMAVSLVSIFFVILKS